MLLKKSTIIFVSLILTYCSFSQNTLIVHLAELKSNKGNIKLELLDEQQINLRSIKQNIVDKQCIIIIDSLYDTCYAIRFIHDENRNQKLDVNWMGIPTEGYGFSNNACGAFGPYAFEKWLFCLEENMTIEIQTKY